jgi:hypothetical protein
VEKYNANINYIVEKMNEYWTKKTLVSLLNAKEKWVKVNENPNDNDNNDQLLAAIVNWLNACSDVAYYLCDFIQIIKSKSMRRKVILSIFKNIDKSPHCKNLCQLIAYYCANSLTSKELMVILSDWSVWKNDFTLWYYPLTGSPAWVNLKDIDKNTVEFKEPILNAQNYFIRAIYMRCDQEFKAILPFALYSYIRIKSLIMDNSEIYNDFEKILLKIDCKLHRSFKLRMKEISLFIHNMPSGEFNVNQNQICTTSLKSALFIDIFDGN